MTKTAYDAGVVAALQGCGLVKEGMSTHQLGNYLTPLAGTIPSFGLAPGVMSAVTAPEGDRASAGLGAGVGGVLGGIGGSAVGAGAGGLLGLLQAALYNKQHPIKHMLGGGEDPRNSVLLSSLLGASIGAPVGGALGAHLGRQVGIADKHKQ